MNCSVFSTVYGAVCCAVYYSAYCTYTIEHSILYIVFCNLLLLGHMTSTAPFILCVLIASFCTVYVLQKNTKAYVILC